MEFHADDPAARRRVLVVTSSMTGAPAGQNLGRPGYSLDFMARQLTPLLARWGEVVVAGRTGADLDAAVRRARAEGASPIHVSFLPLQHMPLTPLAPNVNVPAWEYPDIPDHEFDGNPQNNWVATSQRCALLIVSGPFTEQAFRRGGVRTPIRIAPIPTPAEYFQVAPWVPGQTTVLPGVSCHELVPARQPQATAETAVAHPVDIRQRLKGTMRAAYRSVVRPLTPPLVERALRAVLRLRKRDAGPAAPAGTRQDLVLTGVVYASVFSPSDFRKNWPDLITGFIAALGDCPDATLVLKLIVTDPQWVHRVIEFHHGLALEHRCRIVLLPGYLTEAELVRLAEGSTYHVTTTKAEGHGLPLMNYLAAGRPAVSPLHTAVGDYFTSEMGLVVASHPEPAAWPHDARLRTRTTWHRLVWQSYVDQVRASYRIAKEDVAGYRRMAEAARRGLAAWSRADAVWPRLRDALDVVARHAADPPDRSAA